MLCPAANATCTGPTIGCGKRNAYWLGASTVRLVAGLPLINRSAASTPVTPSVKSTSICVRLRTVTPANGSWNDTVGGTLSTRLYCQVAPGAVALNEFGGRTKSVMPWFATQV